MKEIRKAKKEGNDKTNWTMYVTLFRIIFLFKIQFISFFCFEKTPVESGFISHIDTPTQIIKKTRIFINLPRKNGMRRLQEMIIK